MPIRSVLIWLVHSFPQNVSWISLSVKYAHFQSEIKLVTQLTTFQQVHWFNLVIFIKKKNNENIISLNIFPVVALFPCRALNTNTQQRGWKCQGSSTPNTRVSGACDQPNRITEKPLILFWIESLIKNNDLLYHFTHSTSCVIPGKPDQELCEWHLHTDKCSAIILNQ